MFGVDGMFGIEVHGSYYKWGSGVMLGAGLAGRPGRYALATSAVLGAVITVIGFVAGSEGPNH